MVAKGDRVEVRRNGRPMVVESPPFVEPERRLGPPDGYLRIALLTDDHDIAFRDIEIKELPPTAATTALDQRPDREKLQGTWRCVLFEEAGKRHALDQGPLAKSIKWDLTVHGNELRSKRYFYGPELPAEGHIGRDLQGIVSLDSDKQPKRISVQALKDVGWLGIYKLEGDRLTVCVFADPKKIDYPTEFSTKPGGFSTLMVFERDPSANALVPIAAGGGQFIDKSGDCKMERKAGQITFAVPGGTHDIGPRGAITAPMLVQTVEGDFDIQVRALPAAPREGNCYAALLAMSGTSDLIAINRQQTFDAKNQWILTRSFRFSQNAAEVATGPTLTDMPAHLPLYLRLVRRGNKVVTSYSKDGAKWTDAQTQTVDWPNQVKVGLAAVNVGPNEFRAVFEGFKVSSAEPGWVPLFNGKDLTGWRVVGMPQNSWQIRDGMLWGGGGPTFLVSDRKFTNFDLKAEVRVSPGGDGSVVLRSDPTDEAMRTRSFSCVAVRMKQDLLKLGGTQLSVQLLADQQPKEGDTSSRPFKADEWVLLDIMADGETITVKYTADDFKPKQSLRDVKRRSQSGPIILELGKGEGSLEFRKIEIKELLTKTPQDIQK
jgi:uncharacterized protein (TIGR03067 family)